MGLHKSIEQIVLKNINENKKGSVIKKQTPLATLKKPPIVVKVIQIKEI